MSNLFVVGHAAVPDFKHVHVVPGTRLSFRLNVGGLVHDVHDGTVEAREWAVIALLVGAGAAVIGPLFSESGFEVSM